MGCENGKILKYSHHDLDEEASLRKYEEEIGAFKRNLNQILPKICIEKDVIPTANLENNILKDFSEGFVHFLQQGYFYKQVEGKTYYDARKIHLLLFLLTNDSLIDNSKISYHDKASFIFTFIKTREDQNLCEPLEENEENFLKFIEDVVDVACVGIVECYSKIKEPRDGMLKKLGEIKPLIVKSIIEHLFFTKNKQKSGGLTFEELNKKFESEKLLFKSGYIRDFAWKILKDGKANEMEQKEREAEKAESIKQNIPKK